MKLPNPLILGSLVALAGTAQRFAAPQPAPRPTLQVGPFVSPDASVARQTIDLTYHVDSLIRRDSTFRIVFTEFSTRARSLEPLEDAAASHALRGEVVRIHPDTLHVVWHLVRSRADTIASGREVRTTAELPDLAANLVATALEGARPR